MGSGDPLLEAAEFYFSIGCVLTTTERGVKGIDRKGWRTDYVTRENYVERLTGFTGNVCLLTGAPSSVSDVDGDYAPLVSYMPEFLPATGLVTGHESKPRSHWFYRVVPPENIYNFTVRKIRLIEWRGNAHQTVVPPSVHTSDEPIVFYKRGAPSVAEEDAVLRGCVLLAMVGALSMVWPTGPGSRHELALAVSGGLLDLGLTVEETVKVVRSAARIAGDEEVEDRVQCVFDTDEAREGGIPYTSWKTVGELDPEARPVVAKIRDWARKHLDSAQSAVAMLLGVNDRELAEAARLTFAEQLVYVPDRTQWMRFDGLRWSGVGNGPAMRAVGEYGVRLREQADAGVAVPRRDRDALRAAGVALGNTSKAHAVVTMMESEPRFHVPPEWFDSEPLLMGTPGGTLDLATGALREAVPSDRTSMLTAATPRFDQRPEFFTRFLDTVAHGRAELAAFLAQSFAYSLTGLTRERCFFVLWGMGMNGKSMLLKCVGAAMGSYATAISTGTLAQPDDGRPLSGLARLRGKRFAYTSETAEYAKFNLGLLKRITGADPIVVRDLYERETVFEPQAKLWLATNERPKINEADDAAWTRVRLVPCTHVFPKTRALAEAQGVEFIPGDEVERRAHEEAPLVLGWLASLMPGVLANGIGVSQIVDDATEETRQLVDYVAVWAEERAEVTGSDADFLTTTAAHSDYVAFCERLGYTALSVDGMGRRVTKLNWLRKNVGGQRGYVGVRLREQAEVRFNPYGNLP